jgi:putative ABC transport system ATP-binding protein
LSSLVSLQNVTKYYRVGDEEYQAIKGIDLEVNAGDMLGIVGASGSGKSTLMNIMGFLDCCSSGSYFFSGKNVSSLNEVELANIRNQKIGFIFQSFFLLPRLSVLQNVMLPLLYRQEPSDLAKQKAHDVLRTVSMEKFISHKPNQLSGGQQQRVAIARALIGEPSILFADEPTGSLDSTTSRQVMDLLIQLNQVEQRTIVIITHDKAVSDDCKRVVTICDGLLQ